MAAELDTSSTGQQHVGARRRDTYAACKAVIEGYSEFEPIGEGGFSIVYRARESYVERLVAIKVLRGLDNDTRRHDRFQREVRAMGRLSGIPNIVDIYRPSFTDRGEPCIVMPYLAGGSLAALIQQSGPLPANRVRDIGATIATALATAHQHGIQHRDIKPQNILLDEAGSPHLADFGIAVMDDVRAGTGSAALMSPPHAPPERFNAKNDSTLDELAGDVYSLGSTLHTALAGMPPFGRAEEVGLVDFLDAVRNSPPPPVGDHVPAELREVVIRCLSKDPALRPSARQLAQALSQVPDSTERLNHTSARPMVHERATDRIVDKPRPRATAEVNPPPVVDVPEGSTVARPLPGPAAGAPTGPHSAASKRRIVLASAASAAVLLVAAAAMLLSGRSSGDGADGSGAVDAGNSSATTEAPPVRDLVPPVLEPLEEVSDGFSFRWSDPNEPPAETATYQVFVDDEPTLPQMIESEREQIVTEVERSNGQIEPIDLPSSQYCVIVILSEGLPDTADSPLDENEVPPPDLRRDSTPECTQ